MSLASHHEQLRKIYEGASDIQRLVIGRALGGN